MKLFQKSLVLAFIIIKSLWGNVYAQSAHLDSLQRLLIYFHDNSNDSNFKKAIKQAQTLYTTDSIDDSFATRLIMVEDSLLAMLRENSIMDIMIFDKQKIFAFAEMLVDKFRYLGLRDENLCYASALNNLGSLNEFQDYRDQEKALPLFEKALSIRKRLLGENNPDYAVSLFDVGKMQEWRGNPAKCLSLALEAIKIRKAATGGGDKDPVYADFLKWLAAFYERRHDYNQAAQIAEEELAIRKNIFGEASPRYALRLSYTAFMYTYWCMYTKALPLYKEAIDITAGTIGKENIQYAHCLNGIGSLYYSIGDYKEALPYFGESLRIRKKLRGETYDLPNIIHNIATTYQRLGQYQKALPLEQEAYLLAKKLAGKNDYGYAFYLPTLALLYQTMGQYEDALPLYQEALELTKKSLGENHHNYARALDNLASMYVSMGQYKKALPYAQKALEIRKRYWGENHPECATSLNDLSNIYVNMGQFDTAMFLLKKAITIRKNVMGTEHSDYVKSLSSLANIYMSIGKYDSAMALMEKTAAWRKKALGEDHPDYALSLISLGSLNMRLGQVQDATNLFKDANNIELQYLNRTQTTLSEEQKVTLINEELHQFYFLPSLAYGRKTVPTEVLQQMYNNELRLKGMALDNQQQVLSSIRLSKDSSVLQLYERWRINKNVIGGQLLLPVEKRVSYLDSLKQATTLLEQELSRRSITFHDQERSKTITAQDVAVKLKEHEAAVEFIRFRLYDNRWADSVIYAAIILLPGDSIPKFVSLFEEKQLKKILQPALSTTTRVKELYPGIQISYNKKINQIDSLYRLIWQPLEKYLSNISTIYYAPVGLLYRVAFQALRCDSTHLLLDKYQLNQLLSTRSVILPELVNKPDSINVWGNIQYDLQTNTSKDFVYSNMSRGMDTSASTFNFYTSDTRNIRGIKWKQLPGTKLEMDSISNIFIRTGTGLISTSDRFATEEKFKALDGKSPKVLHMATHGFFLPFTTDKTKNNGDKIDLSNAFTVQKNPMFRSGLILAGGNYAWTGKKAIPGREDGILTAYEIAQMDLSNTDLVVLSACETALGDLQGNEGVIGLQRAFKMAGVKQIIVSLWPVPDKQTVELMTLFYRNWLNGQSTREALRSAQLRMKEKNSPYSWAAFVLVE